MLARCGRVAHICGANENCMRNCNKNLGENRKESQLPSKSEGCNECTRFQWQLRFQGKLGMCPSLAEPDSSGIPRSEFSNYEPQANKKFFDPAIFQKCWRGSGRVALIAARRQRNSRAMLLAHGGGGEKSDSFSRRGEQDRPAL